MFLNMRQILIIHLVPGDLFKWNNRQKKWRVVSKVLPFKEGDTEMLRGKVLICLPDCSQIVLPDDCYVEVAPKFDYILVSQILKPKR